MKKITALIGIIVMLSLTGCGKFDEIKVNSVKYGGIDFYGFRGLEVGLDVEIENPAVQLSLSDMKAVVKYSGKILGNVTVEPFIMKGRTTETYHLTSTILMGDDMEYSDLLMFLNKNYLEDCVVDITVTGKLKCGISKTITKKDVPLKKLMENAKINKK